MTQELCDVCAVGAEDVLTAVNRLGKPVQVLSLNPHLLQDVLEDIRRVGRAVGLPDRAERVINELEREMEGVKKLTGSVTKRQVLWAEWLKPPMNAGHWVPETVEYAGGIEGLARRGGSSIYVDWNAVLKFDPEVIILMPCGFTTKKISAEIKRVIDFGRLGQITAVRNGNVFATDGHNYFSRSGPRLFKGVQILAEMIHPELFPQPIDP